MFHHAKHGVQLGDDLVAVGLAVFLEDGGEVGVGELLGDDEEGEVEETRAEGDPFEVTVVGSDPDGAGLGGLFKVLFVVELHATVFEEIVFMDTPRPELIAHGAGEALIASNGDAAFFGVAQFVTEDGSQVFERGEAAVLVEMTGSPAETLGGEEDEFSRDEGDEVGEQPDAEPFEAVADFLPGRGHGDSLRRRGWGGIFTLVAWSGSMYV